ncbi:MAG: S8 family peptidase [Planctomycetota bacterium]|nr:S8 family peptidase [Planctomycetota bacterium]
MAKVNYLLGRAERLVRKIDAPPMIPRKAHPYTLEKALERIVPKFRATSVELKSIPKGACPHDEAVALLTLHPSYLAKTYFPDSLLSEAHLRHIGSRTRTVSPDAWAIKNPPNEAVAAELFVAGTRKAFERLPTLISGWSQESRGASDIIKIEDVRSYPSEDRVSATKNKLESPFWEVILHATELAESDYILDGFRDYLRELDIPVNLDDRLHAQGLCFLPVRIPRKRIDDVAKFSFLRGARVMPRMRPIVRMSKGSATFGVELPDKDAVDPTIRVAVFDGGLPETPDLSRWTTRRKVGDVGASDPVLVEHGLGVTSALLFGPLDDDLPIPTPYAKADHFRVLDANSDTEGSDEYFKVVKRIMSILETGRYDFANLSVGPELEIEDNKVHLWTSMLDQFLRKGTMLIGIAAGNSGENDHASGNARAQVPSDCVNAMAFGSADSLGVAWKRSAHSSIGPGRSPGIVKPDLLSFGGSPKNPFYVIGTSGRAEGQIGTSFASPNGLRAAIGVRASLGPILSPLALKALLIHRSYPSELPQCEIGWGKVAESLDELIKCEDSVACIVYQGAIRPGAWMRAPIPVPESPMDGLVGLCATICFATDTDPQDSINYTRSGLEVRFRPHEEKKNEEKSRDAKTRSFFSASSLYANEAELRDDAHKWETTLHTRARMRGSSLKNPSFDIHYNAREAGGKASNPQDIQYALIVSIRSPNTKDLNDRIFRRYRTQLEILKPVIEIPITVR